MEAYDLPILTFLIFSLFLMAGLAFSRLEKLEGSMRGLWSMRGLRTGGTVQVINRSNVPLFKNNVLVAGRVHASVHTVPFHEVAGVYIILNQDVLPGGEGDARVTKP